MQLRISAATEGYPDKVALEILCRTASLAPPTVRMCRGKPDLDRKLPGFNNAAAGWYWMVLRDLDHDAGCAAELRQKLLAEPAARMQLRIVVRELEAWLLGDRERFADFLRVSKARIPVSPEELDDPKQTVLRLVTHSRSKTLREDMVPRPGSGAREGPAYAPRLAEFIEHQWRPDVAAQSCDSLRRCLKRLRTWSEEFHG